MGTASSTEFENRNAKTWRLRNQKLQLCREAFPHGTEVYLHKPKLRLVTKLSPVDTPRAVGTRSANAQSYFIQFTTLCGVPLWGLQNYCLQLSSQRTSLESRLKR